MSDSRPRCPKCGEPARNVLVKAGCVKFELLLDGTLGRVVQGSGQKVPMETYECGGGHEWGASASAEE